MKTKLSIMLLSAMTFFSASVFAGGSSQGLVTNTLAHDQGFYTFIAGEHTNKPACASTLHPAWAIDTKTPGGKTMLATLMLAYALGKSVIVYGSGTCGNVWGERENAMSVQLN